MNNSNCKRIFFLQYFRNSTTKIRVSSENNNDGSRCIYYTSLSYCACKLQAAAQRRWLLLIYTNTTCKRFFDNKYFKLFYCKNCNYWTIFIWIRIKNVLVYIFVVHIMYRYYTIKIYLRHYIIYIIWIINISVYENIYVFFEAKTICYMRSCDPGGCKYNVSSLTSHHSTIDAIIMIKARACYKE